MRGSGPGRTAPPRHAADYLPVIVSLTTSTVSEKERRLFTAYTEPAAPAVLPIIQQLLKIRQPFP